MKLVNDQVDNQSNNTRYIVGRKVYTQARIRVYTQVEVQLRNQLRSQVRSQLEDQIYEAFIFVEPGGNRNETR